MKVNKTDEEKMKAKEQDGDEPVNSDDNYVPPGLVETEQAKCDCGKPNGKHTNECQGMKYALGIGDVHVPAPIGNPPAKTKKHADDADSDDFAMWTGAEVDKLPDSSFAVIQLGGKKDEEGKTVPRSLRKLPYKDASGKVDLPHLRNALARLPQADITDAEKASAKAKLEAAAKTAGVGEYSQKEFAELDMEIFATGTWNGDKYTEKDLQDMIKSYQAIGNKVKPYLKLGHNEEQKLAEKSGLFADGKPAMGWMDSLRVVGDKLVAKFKDVPQVIADLVNNGAYKRVSSEIYTNYKFGETLYPLVLKAVALLGADTPAVTTLQDVAALYSDEDKSVFTTVEFTKEFTKEETEMDKVELEKQFAEKEAALTKEFAEKSAKMDEILKLFAGVDDLKKAVLDFNEKQEAVSAKEKLYTEQLAKAKAREVKEFVDGLVKDERILPVQAKLAEEIFSNIGDVETKEIVFTNSKLYGFKEKMTLAETIRQFMASYPKIGMLKEYTSQKKIFSDKNQEAEALIKQYMDDNKGVEYGDAQLAVYAARPELLKLNLDHPVDVDDQEDIEE